MRQTRRSRFATVLSVLISFLFMQFAAAAYACPDLRLDLRAEVVSSAVPENQAMPDCSQIDPQKGDLCKPHCEVASQLVVTPSQTAIEAPVLPLLALIHPAHVHLPAMATGQVELFARVTAPPPSLRFCVLRI